MSKLKRSKLQCKFLDLFFFLSHFSTKTNNKCILFENFSNFQRFKFEILSIYSLIAPVSRYYKGFIERTNYTYVCANASVRKRRNLEQLSKSFGISWPELLEHFLTPFHILHEELSVRAGPANRLEHGETKENPGLAGKNEA